MAQVGSEEGGQTCEFSSWEGTGWWGVLQGNSGCHRRAEVPSVVGPGAAFPEAPSRPQGSPWFHGFRRHSLPTWGPDVPPRSTSAPAWKRLKGS